MDTVRRYPDIFAINEMGRPTTYLSFLVLETMFKKHDRWFTRDDLAMGGWKYSDIDMICRQLKQADFIEENPSQPDHYKYNLNCKNVDLQVGFEKFLVEVYEEMLPVELMLPSTPSYLHKHKPWFNQE